MALEWVVLGVLAAGATAAVGVDALRRRPAKRPVVGWRGCFEAAASDGAEPVRAEGGLELRVRGRLTRWTVHVDRAQAPVADLRMDSERVETDADVWVGWDVSALPSSIEHWPTLPFSPQRAKGRFRVAGRARFDIQSWLDHVYLDLLDVRTSAAASGVELQLANGYLTARVVDARPGPEIIPRAVEALERVVRHTLQASRDGA